MVTCALRAAGWDCRFLPTPARPSPQNGDLANAFSPLLLCPPAPRHRTSAHNPRPAARHSLNCHSERARPAKLTMATRRIHPYHHSPYSADSLAISWVVASWSTLSVTKCFAEYRLFGEMRLYGFFPGIGLNLVRNHVPLRMTEMIKFQLSIPKSKFSIAFALYT